MLGLLFVEKSKPGFAATLVVVFFPGEICCLTSCLSYRYCNSVSREAAGSDVYPVGSVRTWQSVETTECGKGNFVDSDSSANILL